MNKEKQRSIGCGGLTEYPTNRESIINSAMPLETHHELSENLNEQISTLTLLDINQSFDDQIDTNKTINDIKIALKEKDRVIFAVMLLDFDLGLAGAVGTHNAPFDTWVLTTKITRDLYLHPDFGGHEMIITGYDDEAIATDDQGQQHKGLFTLRNSWGDQVGDRGDFYMSYDYFKILVIEAQRIRTIDDGGVSSARG